jgi:hypothetical protein
VTSFRNNRHVLEFKPFSEYQLPHTLSPLIGCARVTGSGHVILVVVAPPPSNGLSPHSHRTSCDAFLGRDSPPHNLLFHGACREGCLAHHLTGVPLTMMLSCDVKKRGLSVMTSILLGHSSVVPSIRPKLKPPTPYRKNHSQTAVASVFTMH